MPGLFTLGDAILLILFPLVHLVDAWVIGLALAGAGFTCVGNALGCLGMILGELRLLGGRHVLVSLNHLRLVFAHLLADARVIL